MMQSQLRQYVYKKTTNRDYNIARRLYIIDHKTTNEQKIFYNTCNVWWMYNYCTKSEFMIPP